MTTHHFVCMMSKTTLFTTLKKMQTTIGGSSNAQGTCLLQPGYSSTFVLCLYYFCAIYGIMFLFL